MKFKYYLRGCGLGILITVFILIIALQSRGGVMTDEKVMERAAELGMVMAEDARENPQQMKETEESTQQSTQQAKPVVNTEQTDKKQTSDVKKQDSEKGDTQKSNSQKSNSQKSNSEKDTQKKNIQEKETQKEQDGDKVISFTVKGGEYCRAISENLYEAGLVADAEEFRKFMQDNDYDNMIRVGTFELKKGMTYKEIAKVLTTKPEK